MYLTPFVVTLLLAAEPDIVAKEIKLKEVEFDSFADVLHVIQRSGTVELSGPLSGAASIEIDMYRKGRKLETIAEGNRFRDATGKSDRIRFVLNVVDMDYLTLGDGRKGHCRLRLKIGTGNVVGSGTLDVPKKECDFSKLTLVNGFAASAASGERIPVLWMIDSSTASLITSGTPEQILKANPKADLAIVYIRIEKQEED